MRYWLMKSEPSAFSLEDLKNCPDGTDHWDGIRNYQARNNLREMKPGDGVLVYHSGKEKQVVGVAEVTRAAFPDPSAKEGDWSAVELKALKTVARLTAGIK